MGVDLLLRLASPRLFVVPSAFLREKLTVREGLVPGRVRVLPWPVEPTICRGAPPAPRPDPRRRLLFVGTLIPEKGAHVLVEAFRLAHGECPSLALTLVGEGPASFVRTLEETARGLPVAFRGRLDRPGVTAEYAGHDVLVFPSVWEEPYAVVPTEGMAMGLALVATRTGGTPEAVRHGATGLLVPPGDARALADAVLRLARDGELASRLAREGQRWALEERGFDPFMTALEALYAEGAGAGRMAA
jgi:glycosyltransferase involved in cell wall biosynthesis